MALSENSAEHLLLPGPRRLLLSAPLQCAASEIKGPPVRGRETGQSCSGEKRRWSDTSQLRARVKRVTAKQGHGGLGRRARNKGPCLQRGDMETALFADTCKDPEYAKLRSSSGQCPGYASSCSAGICRSSVLPLISRVSVFLLRGIGPFHKEF